MQDMNLDETWGTVYVNGRLVPARDAVVSACDRGLLYGDGIFETVRVYDGKPFMLDAHISRMAEGCSVTSLCPPDAEEVRRAARDILDANRLTSDAYLRITVTRGATGRMWYDLGHDQTTLVLLAKPYDPPNHGRGLRLTVSASFRSDERCPLSRIKHTGILWKILPRAEAKGSGFDDALLMNTANQISEATSANAFWVRDGKLYTPDLACGILPGVTRSIVMQVARENGVAVVEDCLPLAHLLGAEEMFLTSSTAELTPIRSVNDTAFESPGTMTRRLTALYGEYVTNNL